MINFDDIKSTILLLLSTVFKAKEIVHFVNCAKNFEKTRQFLEFDHFDPHYILDQKWKWNSKLKVFGQKLEVWNKKDAKNWVVVTEIEVSELYCSDLDDKLEGKRIDVWWAWPPSWVLMSVVKKKGHLQIRARRPPIE